MPGASNQPKVLGVGPMMRDSMVKKVVAVHRVLEAAHEQR